MSIWNDTFKIEITIMENPYQNKKTEYVEYFKGSLKGAIRHVFSLEAMGNITAVFYNSKGEYIKEIGF